MDDPWFVRRRPRAGSLRIDPVSRAGWALFGGYVLLVTAASALFPLAGSLVGVIGFVIGMLALTAAFILIAYRTSVSEAEWRKNR